MRSSSAIALAFICSGLTAGAAVTAADYGQLADGRHVTRYTLTNTHGITVQILDWGATLAAVEIPDRRGRVADVTLGYDTVAGWLGDRSHLGATIGRYANRIAGARFTLDGTTYILTANNAPAGIPCLLHGGRRGLDKKLWTGGVCSDGNGVELACSSPDGEEGFPGTLQVHARFTLNDANELRLSLEATTDKPTVVNLTNHTYWNLSGDPRHDILGHELEIEADGMLPVSPGMIPTGEIRRVAGSPFDFTRLACIGRQIAKPDPQIATAKGFDHCWVLRPARGVRLAARLVDPGSGRVLDLLTDQPGVQFYTGNALDGSITGKQGIRYRARAALCLEPGKFPDSPNQPQFPSTTLRPGETYHETIVWRFSTVAALVPPCASGPGSHD